MKNSIIKINSKTLNKDIDMEVMQVTENGEILSMITHDSLNDIVNELGIIYEYTLKACNLDHAVVECKASYEGKTVIGIGETVTSKLAGLSASIPTQMAYKRAFDASIISLLRFPSKIYTDCQLGKEMPEKIDLPNAFMAEEEKAISKNAPVTITEEASTEGETGVLDDEIPSNESTETLNAAGEMIISFSEKLKGKKFKEIKPTKDWLAWLLSDQTDESMKTKDKDIYKNFIEFKKYISFKTA